MQTKVIFTLIGFFIGAFSVPIVAYFLIDKLIKTDTTNFQPQTSHEFLLNSKAMRDKSKCHDVDHNRLIGKWAGENETQIWTNVRKKDGTFKIHFKFLPKGRKENFVEAGYWSFSNCLYTVVTTSIDDRPVVYQEVYRVHELSENQMSYTNYRSGNSFVLKKVPNEIQSDKQMAVSPGEQQ